MQCEHLKQQVCDAEAKNAAEEEGSLFALQVAHKDLTQRYQKMKEKRDQVVKDSDELLLRQVSPLLHI